MIPLFIDVSKIPHKPGIYIYKNSDGKILYVGKAIDLYHRVSSYFSGDHDLKTTKLVSEISDLETIIVNSELEALILEANLIKKYLPPFNIKLTDDKDYLYIKITNEEYPQVLVARKKDLTDAKEYFGPFPSGKTVRTTLKKLRKIFPWCSNPDGKKPCFYYHLNLCPGPCAGKIEFTEYQKIIRRFSKFMQGKTDEVLNDLQKEMKDCVTSLEFEKAQSLKKTIEGLQYLTQTNNAEIYLENPNFIEDQTKKALADLKIILKLQEIPKRIECFDVSNISGKDAVGSLVVLTEGEIDKKWYRRFKIQAEGKPNDVLMMREIVSRRLNHNEWPKPDLILVDGGKPQVGAALKEILVKGLEIPVFGLAKKMEWLISADYITIKLPRTSLALQMLQKIRDEAHRFAISYHKKLRVGIIKQA